MQVLKNLFFSPNPDDFEKKGFVTPEQFVEAGDKLTMFGWKWEKAVDEKKQFKFLPPNKQYLSTSGRSSKRIKDVLKEETKGKEAESGFISYDDEGIAKNKKNQGDNEEDDCIIMPCRKYLLSITFDEKWHCPRLWLTGQDDNGQPLTAEQIFEDIMAEYQNETATYENHPHLGVKQVTIHPCRHSDVIKTFVQGAKQKGIQIKPNQVLAVFLKFMVTVMPTIEYDATCDVDVCF